MSIDILAKDIGEKPSIAALLMSGSRYYELVRDSGGDETKLDICGVKISVRKGAVGIPVIVYDGHPVTGSEEIKPVTAAELNQLIKAGCELMTL